MLAGSVRQSLSREEKLEGEFLAGGIWEFMDDANGPVFQKRDLKGSDVSRWNVAYSCIF